MYNIVVSEHASSQLIEIKHHLSNTSIEMANRITNEILEFVVERLSAFPLSGPRVFENQAYRNIFKHSYRIIYKVIENDVNILSIVHTHQDIEKIIQQIKF